MKRCNLKTYQKHQFGFDPSFVTSIVYEFSRVSKFSEPFKFFNNYDFQGREHRYTLPIQRLIIPVGIAKITFVIANNCANSTNSSKRNFQISDIPREMISLKK